MLKIILSVLVVVVLVGGIVVGVYFIRQQQVLKARADVDLEPKDTELTNLSESSLTISWLTPPKETTGFVLYGEDQNKLDNSATDIRGATVSSKTHYVVLERLKSSTSYYFQISSGGKQFKTPIDRVTTLSSVSSPPSPSDPLFGKTVSGQSPASGVIVYLYLKGSSQLAASALSENNGTFTLDLSALRPDGKDYYAPNTADQIKIVAKNGDSQTEFQGQLGNRQASLSLNLHQQQSRAVLEGDFNDDGVVNAVDVGYFIKLWLAKDPKADLNKDGITNTLDYGEMLKKLAR